GVLKDAGIEQVDQYEQAEISVEPKQLGQKLARIGRYELDSPGMPVSLVAKLPDGKVKERAITRDRSGEVDSDTLCFYADVRAQGAIVEGKFRVASKQQIVRDTPPEQPDRSEDDSPPAPPAPQPSQDDEQEPTPAPKKRHYGPTYDPEWLAAQYWLALKLLGWVQRGEDKLICPNTGQVARKDMTPLELIECILGRPV